MPVDSGLIMFAHELADTAGEIIRPYFRRRIEVTDKGLAKGKVFDPVDGTRAFISGRHEWASLIGLEENGRAVLGIIEQPVLGERFIGTNGKAELLSGGGTHTALRVRPCEDLSQAVLCATHPDAYF